MKAWQKFEHLIAKIHEVMDPDLFTVEHDVTLTEPGGATAQVDVVLTPKSPFVGRVLISCKSSGDPVGIDHIREWANIVQETGAAAGVIVSPTGFTSGAIEAARVPSRRLSLWKPRALTDADFGPDAKSPNGYVKSIVTTLHVHAPRPREESFQVEVESTSDKREGRMLEFRFSAATRERYYLRDERDNVVGNLWDEYIAAAERLTESAEARVEFDEPRFLVLDGHRARFKFLSVYIDVGRFDLTFETDFAKLSFAYENCVSGETQIIPLPSNMLDH